VVNGIRTLDRILARGLRRQPMALQSWRCWHHPTGGGHILGSQQLQSPNQHGPLEEG